MGEPLSPSGRDAAGLLGWSAEWRGLRVVVLGLGVAGFAFADTLVELGAEVTVLAADAADDRRELVGIVGAQARLVDDAAMAAALREIEPDLVLVSPGFARDHPALEAAREAGVPVWGELETAWRLRDKHGEASRWLLVAGGTPERAAGVAEAAAAMLRAEGIAAVPAGEGSLPVLDAIRDPAGYPVLVIAASAAQLSALPAPAEDDAAAVGDPRLPAPLAAVVLRFPSEPPAEAARFGGDEAYRAALGGAYHRVRVACVYDLGDAGTRELVEQAVVHDGARAIGVGLGVPGPSDLGVVDGILVDRAFLEERRSHALELGSLETLLADGRGTPEQVHGLLTAAALARAAGATPAAVARVLGGG
ncbi:MAG: hypothetical protein J0G30_09080 [Actinomycetales bacterium]|nr:hypothetical protein [Actinomycetales bacterium]